ncbi:MAG: lysoplasmalogenase [Chloroflexota bacterium]|nr:MAG: lysoplasmalogenase [Chloroflexota bacterium]
MTRIILTMLAIGSASIHLWGEYQGPALLIYVFKPLTMIFIISIAVLAKEPPSMRYKLAIIAGLSFSMLGDILLMLPVDLFLAGLVTFLLAQVIYIYAFRSGRAWRKKFIALLPLIIYGAIIYVVLLPNLNGLEIPVAGYILVILIMAWQAWDLWDVLRTRWALLAFLGALLFVVSDSILAINRFGEPFIAARALTLTTYFSAQWLISNSNYTSGKTGLQLFFHSERFDQPGRGRSD